MTDQARMDVKAVYMLTTITTFCWSNWRLNWMRGAKTVFVQAGPIALSFKFEASHDH